MKIQTVDATDSKIAAPLNRGELFGDGFFTTGLIELGQIKHLSYHLRRLEESASRLKFDNFPLTEIEQQLLQLTSSQQQATFRLTISRSQNIRGYAISDTQKISASLIFTPWTNLPEQFFHLEFAETPISVNPLLAGIKHLNRLDNVMAASEIEAPVSETLLCDGENIISGSRSNFFVYIDDQWQTPILKSSGIEGITKRRLMALAKEQQVTISHSEISRLQVDRWQSAFVTNSLLGLWPVKQIGNKQLDTQIALQLQSQLNFSR